MKTADPRLADWRPSEAWLRAEAQASQRGALWPSVWAIIFAAAMCDMLVYLHIGSTSLNAIFTSAVLGACLLDSLALLSKGSARTPAAFLAPFVGWAALRGVTDYPGFGRTQNLFVYAIFASAIRIGASMREEQVGRIAEILGRVCVLLPVVYMVTSLPHGLNSNGVVSRRSFALEALVLACIGAGLGLKGRLGGLAFWLPLIGICVSLSRTAMAGALILASIKVSTTSARVRRLRLLLIGAALALAGSSLFARSASLQERFSGGDAAFHIGGLSINTEGRDKLWLAIIDGIPSSPWVGHGLGSAELLITRTIPGESEPHNDALRLIYDFGILGFLLFAGGILSVAYSCARIQRLGSPQLRRFALLALAVVCLTSLTDNGLTYNYVVAPFGLFLGIAARGAPSQGQDDEDLLIARRDM